MRMICVDDALPIMEDTVAMCEKIPQVTSVKGFTRPREAVEWLEKHPVDIALLDIDMPEIDGLLLAQKLKQRYPDAAVIFLTAYEQFAVQAFRQHASGYLLKPVAMEDLREEIAYACSRKRVWPSGHIVVKTFGDFEIFVDGETLPFRRMKSKELLDCDLYHFLENDPAAINAFRGEYLAAYEWAMFDEASLVSRKMEQYRE